MKNLTIKHLPRDKFNELVKLLEKMNITLGVKKIDGLVEYSYVDENKTLITIICDEGESES